MEETQDIKILLYFSVIRINTILIKYNHFTIFSRIFHNQLLINNMYKIPKCINNSLATLICINDQCVQPNPFVCGANHECFQKHRRCAKLQWISFRETLEENKYSTDPTFKFFCNKVEKVITKGIEQLKTELINFSKWKQHSGRVEKVIEFQESLELNREAMWTGKDINQLRNDQRRRFDNINLDQKMIEGQVTKIQAKQQQVLVMIKKLYQTQQPKKIKQIQQTLPIQIPIQTTKQTQQIKQAKQIPQFLQSHIQQSHIQQLEPLQRPPTFTKNLKALQIKNKWLSGLIKKLEEIEQLPEQLELKFSMFFITMCVRMNIYCRCKIKSQQYSVFNYVIVDVTKKSENYLVYGSILQIQRQDIKQYREYTIIGIILEYLFIVSQYLRCKLMDDRSQGKLNILNRVQMQKNIVTVEQNQIFKQVALCTIFIRQVAKAFLSVKLRNLRMLTIYFGYQSAINEQYCDTLSSSLMKLPKLQQFTMVVQDGKSQNSFKQLGSRFKMRTDKGWWQNEQW